MQSVSVTRDPAAQYEIRGGGGLKLHVQEWGDPHGPALLLIHGWSQSQLCWKRQVESPLAETFRIVTFDNRGHGMSERPLTPGHYLDEQRWADDIAAIIEQTGLDRPILVAWSYGGFIVADYVRAYGQDKIGGINLVGGAVLLKPPSFDHIGPGFLENAEGACSADLSTNIAAIRRFLRACTARPLSDDDWSAALSWNMVVPAEVRAALISRALDADDVLSTLTVPISSRTAVQTQSSCRRWPSTCSPCATPPRRPGTRASVTCPSGKITNGSTANSPISWPLALASCPAGCSG